MCGSLSAAKPHWNRAREQVKIFPDDQSIRIPQSEIRNTKEEDTMEVEKKLTEMGLSLPPSPAPVANYVPAVRSGNLLFVSGHGPALVKDGKIEYIRGKLGRELTVEQGYDAARQVMLNILQSIKGVIGDLDKVRRIVKVLGFVNCTEDFPDQPKVINGASDLLVALYGERGRHARSAVGMQQLPFGIAVEIEMVVEVEG
jgi:enamine deaminase RidA (YjgF/YER057c/UK114 family)